MLLKLVIVLFLMNVMSNISSAQSASHQSSKEDKRIPYTNKTWDSIQIRWVDSIAGEENREGLLIRNTCKGYMFLYPVVETETVVLKPGDKKIISEATPGLKKKTPLLQAKGNILYDVTYRSRIDTPYAQSDVYQHTIQTRLDMLYKGEYPFKIYITSRFGNSPFFRRYTDLNVLYSQQEFTRSLKKKILEKATVLLMQRMGYLDSLKKDILSRRLVIDKINRSLQRPDLSQKMVEEREKELSKNKIDPPGLSPDSTGNGQQTVEWRSLHYSLKEVSTAGEKNTGTELPDNRAAAASLKDSINSERRKVDSLQEKLGQVETLYESLLHNRETSLSDLRKEIEGTSSSLALQESLRKYAIPDSSLPKGYKTLFAIHSLGIGRSIVDYSELSVKNISITGIQAEFNPRYYYAVAAGKVDYRFRDYIVPANSRSDQYVVLVQFGKGLPESNHIFFTWYTGKRQFFNSSLSTLQGSATTIPSYNLAGITAEVQYKIGRYISVVAEVAKSTVPYYSLDSLERKKWMSSVTRLKDRTNEAVSLKTSLFIPSSQTRLYSSFRYTGANFQSFSSFSTGSSQKNWIVKMEQPLFKRKLNFTGSVQQNDYINPFVSTTYKSSSVLASMQATLRIKKWPVISLGYYPSYQLTKLSDNDFAESRYYTLMANAGYFYKIHNTQLSTYIVYSRFYNQSVDSGFVYYNAKNILVSQNIILNPVSILFNFSASSGNGTLVRTIENNDQVRVSRIVSVGAGAKMILQSGVSSPLWGYTLNMGLKVGRLGEIQLMMDKGFIPGLNRQLVENKIGRLTYIKTF